MKKILLAAMCLGALAVASNAWADDCTAAGCSCSTTITVPPTFTGCIGDGRNVDVCGAIPNPATGKLLNGCVCVEGSCECVGQGAAACR